MTQCIVELDLSSNSITSAGGADLIRSLERNQSLIHLNLSSHEGLQRNTLGALGVKPFKDVLKVNRYLTILNLSGCFIGDIGLGYICDGLQGSQDTANKTLNELNLALNEITSDGVEKMVKSLKYTAVKVINFTRNPLKNKGAKAIGEMLVRGSDIKIDVLNLTECQITHMGAVYIY